MLGCEVESSNPQAITVAYGNHIPCDQICKNLRWRMSNTEFTSEAMLIPLGGCDMVLGIQWLSTLGSVSWDFKKLRMKFMCQGTRVLLKGVPSQKPKVIEKQPSLKMLNKAAQLCFIQVRECSVITSEESSKSLTVSHEFSELEELKKKYVVVFEEPVELPPHRGVHDHRIPLEPNARPVNIRPYRYPLK